MQKYELFGEPLTSAFPATVENIQFHGVEILRITGAEADVQATTDMIDAAYPGLDKTTFGDARITCYQAAPRGKPATPVYELIVLRRLSSGN